MPIRRHSLELLAVVALPVVALDLATKQLAVATLAGREVPLTSFARLLLVHNRASALGVWLGAHTWGINVAFTAATVVVAALVCRGLTAVDRTSPYALGLIAGAALGNLISLLIPPAGVPDFLSVGLHSGRQLIFNLADVAAYVGVVMCVRTAVVLARAARVDRAPQPAAGTIAEREVAIPLAAERARGERARGERARGERGYGDGPAFPLTADGVAVRRAAMDSPSPSGEARS